MYGIGFNHLAGAVPAYPATALPAPGATAAGGFPASFAVPAFHADPGFAMPSQPERFINAHAGGVLLDKAGSPTARIPEGSFVDAKEGRLHGPDGKLIAIPEGGSFDLFDMPDVAELVAHYKDGTAAFEALRGGGTTVGGSAYPMQQYPPTSVDGQWGPGGVTPFKGGAAATKPGCDQHHTTQVGGARGSGMISRGTAYGPMRGGMMPPAKVLGGGGVPALAAQLQQALMQAHQLAGGGLHGPMPGAGAYGRMPGMVAGVNGGGALDAMSATGPLGGMPGLQQSLQELVVTLRQLTMALQGTDGGGPAKQAPPKVDATKPATETSASATTTTAATTATAGASGSGTSSPTSTDDSSGSSTDSTSTSTSTST